MKMNEIGINAHRGMPAVYPENTIPSFQHAARLPVTAIEFDVHLSRDGKMVVTHDALIDRCSDGHGPVCGFTLEELRQFDFGAWKEARFSGTRIPTLEDVVDAIFSIDPAKRLLIEVKENNVECAAALLEFVRANELLERSMISSFHLDVLAFLRKAEPAAKLHGNDVTPNGVPEEVAGLIDSIGIQSKFATPERIRHYKAKGIKVDSWVINDRDALVRAIENGTESVTTDVPDLVCRWLGRSSLPDQ